MVKMQCRICDKIFFFSLEEVQAVYPTHCGGIGLSIDFKAFESAQQQWLDYKPYLPLEKIK